jgi:hypothetical protein
MIEKLYFKDIFVNESPLVLNDFNLTLNSDNKPTINSFVLDPL